jgi:putative thiamine transport system permease protein
MHFRVSDKLKAPHIEVRAAGEPRSIVTALFPTAPLFLLFILPLALSLLLILPGFADIPAFKAFFAHPQFPGGLQLTLFTGITSTILSLVFAVMITASLHKNRATEAGAFLALPHLAFAIGLGFLIAPAGLLSRVIAVAFTGVTSPPAWVTTQDPHGLALTAALVLKETPFLVWAISAVLQRDDMSRALKGQMAVAQSLGHGFGSAWLRVVSPQVLRLIRWPLVAVFAYGMTVVDMALVIGPTQPPTLAQVIWTDLNDADIVTNARGSAGVLTLSIVILILLWVVGLLLRLGRPYARRFISGYPPSRNIPIVELTHLWGFWRLSYGAVGLALVLQSVSGLWPFPRLVAEQFTAKAWQNIVENPAPMLTSLVLALCTSTLGLVANVTWLERQSITRDRFMLAACVVTLCLPALVIGLGEYRLLLQLGMTGTASGLFIVHIIPVAAYQFILLQGPYRGFDQRWRSASNGLSASPAKFLIEIKWPLLKAPLFAAAAVGFAVSMAQYVPAQLAAAGRYSTLPMEAVTLTTGSNRALLAAYALLLMSLPLVVFVLAGRLGRSRWSAR